jgi:hypothetical protein
MPILYGLPGDEALADAYAGRVSLGGCVVTLDDPDTGCPRGHQWRGSLTRPPRPRGPKTRAQRRSMAGREETASEAFASGRYDDAAGVYRTLVAMAAEEHGDDHRETRVFRHALALVLDAAGRTEDAEAAYAPIRRRRDEERQALLRQDPR